MIRKQLDMRNEGDGGTKMTLRSNVEAAWWVHDDVINLHTDQGRSSFRRKATNPLGRVGYKGFRDGQVDLLLGRWLETQSLYPRILVRTRDLHLGVISQGVQRVTHRK